jgi:pimeloyl-ACP methyl ester carboxylesterase
MSFKKKTAMNTSAAGSSQGSQLARLQQFMVCWTFLLALLRVTWWWDRWSPVAMLAGVMIVMGFSLVLGLEFWLAVREHRDDATPRARSYQVLKAWWSETMVAAAVFCWRQPFRWRLLPDTLTGDHEDLVGSTLNSTRPVVFVHGFVCNRGFWHPWMEVLQARSIPYLSMNLEPVMGEINGFVAQLENAIQKTEAAGSVKPVLICHSMGGLVARAWRVAAPGNGQRIARIITIGTPHQGTWLARWSRTRSGKEMQIGSGWLKALRQRESLMEVTGTAPITCWYSNTDNIVFPPSMATLYGSDNRLVEGAGHVALAFHPRVMRESLNMLASGEISPMLRTAS